MQVLIVEDDVRLAQALGHILKENGYDADVVHDGLTGLAYGEDGRYDVIILDVMLPKMDGFAVASALRRKGVSTPVLLLTARDAVADKITGLDSGADDYMTKPFSPAELLAHLRALTRRQGEVVFETLRAGDLELNLESYDLACNAKSIHLSSQGVLHLPDTAFQSGPGGVEGPVDRQSMGRGVERRRQQRGGLHLVFAQEVRVPGVGSTHRDAAQGRVPVHAAGRARGERLSHGNHHAAEAAPQVRRPQHGHRGRGVGRGVHRHLRHQLPAEHERRVFRPRCRYRPRRRRSQDATRERRPRAARCDERERGGGRGRGRGRGGLRWRAGRGRRSRQAPTTRQPQARERRAARFRE